MTIVNQKKYCWPKMVEITILYEILSEHTVMTLGAIYVLCQSNICIAAYLSVIHGAIVRWLPSKMCVSGSITELTTSKDCAFCLVYNIWQKYVFRSGSNEPSQQSLLILLLSTLAKKKKVIVYDCVCLPMPHKNN